MKFKIDVEAFVILFIVLIGSFFGYAYAKGSLDITNFISNIGGSYLNVFAWCVVFYGIEFFQRGFNHNVRNEITEKQNVAAAIYQGSIAIALALLIAKGLL